MGNQNEQNNQGGGQNKQGFNKPGDKPGVGQTRQEITPEKPGVGQDKPTTGQDKPSNDQQKGR